MYIIKGGYNYRIRNLDDGIRVIEYSLNLMERSSGMDNCEPGLVLEDKNMAATFFFLNIFYIYVKRNICRWYFGEIDPKWVIMGYSRVGRKDGLIYVLGRKLYVLNKCGWVLV